MNKEIIELTQYMKEQIPLLHFQEMDIKEYSMDTVRLEAPLMPNKNVHQTAYAGALSSLLTISSWLMAKAWVDQYAPQSSIVLQSCSINYLRPVKNTLIVKAESPNKPEWEKSFQELKAKGYSRIEINAKALNKDKSMAVFKGLFYIKKSP